MNTFKQYHHFKGNDLSPSEKVQKKVIEIILNSKVPDSKRDSSKIFELKHSSECIQIARILAQKRNLNVSLSETIAALHDIFVIVSGSYEKHAVLGGSIAKKILTETGGFSEEEIEIIVEAVSYHSEKDIISTNPYVEMIKDADVFASSFYENSEDEYRRIKTKEIFDKTAERITNVRRELNLPPQPIFR